MSVVLISILGIYLVACSDLRQSLVVIGVTEERETLIFAISMENSPMSFVMIPNKTLMNQIYSDTTIENVAVDRTLTGNSKTGSLTFRWLVQ